MTQREINEARLFIDAAGKKQYLTRSLDALERIRLVCTAPQESPDAILLRERVLAAMERR